MIKLFIMKLLGLAFCTVSGSIIVGRWGWYGTVVKNYHDNEHYKYKEFTVNKGIFFTVESKWIDPTNTQSDLQCYKNTKLYFRPIQVFHNDKHIYTDPALRIIKRTNNFSKNKC